MDGDEPLATIRPGPFRRLVALGVIAGLAALLLSLAAEAFWTGASIGALVFAFSGGLAVWAAVRVGAATTRALVLRRDGLYDDTGEVLAPLDAIARVDRGAFAFKPSSGFSLILDRPYPRHWAPGLWWRYGRRVGVGGTLSHRDARGMADFITLLLTERAQKR